MGATPADFLEFARARSDQLFRTACLLTGDRHPAEDLVQETLAKMYRSRRRIDRTHAPVAYAHTALVRAFTSYRRRRSSHEHPVERVPEDTATRSGDPDLRLTLLDGLARLSPDRRRRPRPRL
ncbi:sigma factor, partial [Kitasatospora sp. NPDC001574]